jgi:hypothetical protein
MLHDRQGKMKVLACEMCPERILPGQTNPEPAFFVAALDPFVMLASQS